MLRKNSIFFFVIGMIFVGVSVKAQVSIDFPSTEQLSEEMTEENYNFLSNIQTDCNSNLVSDRKDIDTFKSKDTNHNDLPDECESNFPGFPPRPTLMYRLYPYLVIGGPLFFLVGLISLIIGFRKKRTKVSR